MPKCTLRDAVETVLQNHRIVFKNSDNTPTRNESLPGIHRIAWPTVRSLTVGVMREIIRAVQSTDEAKGYAFVYVSFTSPSRGENHGLIVGLTTREDVLSSATKVDSGGIWAWANDTHHVYTCSGPDDSDMLCSPDSEVAVPQQMGSASRPTQRDSTCPTCCTNPSKNNRRGTGY